MLVRDVVAADNVIDYAARLVRATRPSGGDGDVAPDFIRQWVRWGAGPRAGQSLLLAGKARAVLHGRPAVSLEDVRAVAPPCCAIALLVNFQAEADGIDAETGRHAPARRRAREVNADVAAARRHVRRASVASRSRAVTRPRSKACGRVCTAVRFTATARSSASIATIAPATT